MLLIAVAFLFYHMFSATPITEQTSVDANHQLNDTLKTPDDGLTTIAFVYGDSINKQYEFILDAEKELEKDQKIFDERVKNKMKRAEDRYRELMAQAQTMSQQEMQQAQAELQQLDLDMQKYQEELAMEYRKKEADLQKDYVNRIQTYLDKYNAEHNYDYIVNYQVGGQVLLANDAHDITPEVVAGLNADYKAEKDVETEEK